MFARDSSWPVEKPDDPCRKARELVERANDWLARDRASLAERYLNGDIDIVIRRFGRANQCGAFFHFNGREIGFDEKSASNPTLKAGSDSEVSRIEINERDAGGKPIPGGREPIQPAPSVVQVLEQNKNVASWNKQGTMLAPFAYFPRGRAGEARVASAGSDME